MITFVQTKIYLLETHKCAGGVEDYVATIYWGHEERLAWKTKIRIQSVTAQTSITDPSEDIRYE